MNVGVIDADLIGRKNHRFPNLALMKISGFHGGAKLLLSYDEVPNYEKYYLSEKMQGYFITKDEKQKAKGNGFRFAPTDGGGIAKTVKTKAGQRIEDNYLFI